MARKRTFIPFWMEEVAQLHVGDHLQIPSTNEGTGEHEAWDVWVTTDAYGNKVFFSPHGGADERFDGDSEYYVVGRNWHGYPKEKR